MMTFGAPRVARVPVPAHFFQCFPQGFEGWALRCFVNPFTNLSARSLTLFLDKVAVGGRSSHKRKPSVRDEGPCVVATRRSDRELAAAHPLDEGAPLIGREAEHRAHRADSFVASRLYPSLSREM